MVSDTKNNPGKFFMDALVKVLAILFLNPADRNGQGKKIFVQRFLGCGCPDDVVAQAKIRFFARPLGDLLEEQMRPLGPVKTGTLLEQSVNHLLKLPKTLQWPRRRSGRLAPPASWSLPMVRAVSKRPKHAERLAFLRAMCETIIDAVIEVPGRAFFFIVTEERKRLSPKKLLVQYESGQLLYQLAGYNRCRLFTITQNSGSKIIPQVDTALSWQGLYEVFDQVRHGYPFAHIILKYFETDR